MIGAYAGSIEPWCPVPPGHPRTGIDDRMAVRNRLKPESRTK
jgi:hypothetical protein